MIWELLKAPPPFSGSVLGGVAPMAEKGLARETIILRALLRVGITLPTYKLKCHLFQRLPCPLDSAHHVVTDNYTIVMWNEGGGFID